MLVQVQDVRVQGVGLIWHLQYVVQALDERSQRQEGRPVLLQHCHANLARVAADVQMVNWLQEVQGRGELGVALGNGKPEGICLLLVHGVGLAGVVAQPVGMAVESTGGLDVGMFLEVEQLFGYAVGH